MAEIFNSQYALQYDGYSASPPRTYEIGAKALVGIDGGIGDGDLVVEIGSGTGNSSIILATSNPNLRRLICIEPSDFISLAAHKFGKRELSLPNDLPEGIRSYIEQQQQRALQISGKIDLVRGRMPSLPIGSSIADRVYCASSFHWFAFRGQLSPQPDFDHLNSSVAEIARILRGDGRFLFDSNGHILNFGDEEVNGKRINDVHFTKHPLWEKFNSNFYDVLSRMGFQVKDETQTPDRLQQIFNLTMLEDILNKNGLYLIPNLEGGQYLLTLIPYDRERLINSARSGAKMNKFSTTELTGLSEREKGDMVEQALQQAIEENPKAFDDDYYETFITFVAQKAA